MTDAELVERYPDVPWRLPVEIRVTGKQGKRFACRLCVARFGLKAQNYDTMYRSEDEHKEHMTQFH